MKTILRAACIGCVVLLAGSATGDRSANVAVFGGIARGMQVAVVVPAASASAEAAQAADRALDDELLFREALRRGYHRDDLIVRRQLERRMQQALLLEHPVPAPDDRVLEEFLHAHQERYQSPSRWSFDQVYLSRGAHQAALEGHADAVGARLRAEPSRFADLGDPFPGGNTFRSRMQAQITAEFGAGFAQALAGLPVGEWRGPVASPLGLHWVRVNGIAAAHPFTLNEIRPRLLVDYRQVAEQAVLRQALTSLRTKYDQGAGPRTSVRVPNLAEEDELP
jgi:hypothetical protein